MDKTTVFKESMGYYQIHREQLLKDGYKITKDTRKYTVFEKPTEEKITPYLTKIK